MLTIKQILSNISKSIQISEARILASYALNISIEKLILDLDLILDEKKEAEIMRLFERRIRGEPIAYITEKKEFYGLEFIIKADVLIPRPETELMVDAAREFLHIKPVVMDMCCGSGAVGIALAKNFDLENITFVDISKKALEIAELNAKKHDIQNAEFFCSDFFDKLEKREFDAILCNPPYISKSDIDLISRETIEYEPHLALFAENFGMAAYEVIANSAKPFLKKGGVLILESGYDQSQKLRNLFEEKGFEFLKLYKDLSLIDRCLVFRNN